MDGLEKKGKSVLHVGCGTDSLPDWITGHTEIRLDIDPSVKPHIVADMTDLSDVKEHVDGVYCSHALEHLHGSDVTKALNEFYRVIKIGGTVIIFVPDLEGVKPTDEVLFESPAGVITGLDLMFGFRPVTKDNPFMRHLTGFISSTLEKALANSGFTHIKTLRIHPYNLLGVGCK